MQGSVINTVCFILYLVYKVQVPFDSNIMVYISLQRMYLCLHRCTINWIIYVEMDIGM